MLLSGKIIKHITVFSVYKLSVTLWNNLKTKTMQLNDITHEILDSAYKVHSILGPGLLESAYQACLVYELRKKGLSVEVEKALPLIYEELKLLPLVSERGVYGSAFSTQKKNYNVISLHPL